MMWMTTGPVLALSLVLGLAPSVAMADDHEEPQITVTGEGEATAVPDIATLSIGVETEAATPGEALSDNAARMTRVISQLQDAGIADKDLQTSQLGIWPVFADRQQPQKTVGYRVSNQLSVTIRDIDRLGALLDAAVADGANRVNGPTFGIGDPAPLLTAARKAAVQDAIAKAALYAEAAGVELGDILSISEAGGGPVFPRHARAQAMAAETPIAAGESTVTASVTITFELGR